MTTRPLLLALALVTALMVLLLTARDADVLGVVVGPEERVDPGPPHVTAPIVLEETLEEPELRSAREPFASSEPAPPADPDAVRIPFLVTRIGLDAPPRSAPPHASSVTLALREFETGRLLHIDTAESGADGRGLFVLPLAAANVELQLELDASAPGWVCDRPWRERYVDAEHLRKACRVLGAVRPARLLLREGLLLQGRVLDSASRAVFKAEVSVQFFPEERPENQLESRRTAAASGHASTDLSGEYRAVLDKTGTWRVSANGVGRGTTATREIEVRSFHSPPYTLDFTLHGAGSLTGQVKRPDGFPVEGAIVLAVEKNALLEAGHSAAAPSLRALGTSYPSSDQGFRCAYGKSAERGWFCLEGLLPGEYVVAAVTKHSKVPTSIVTAATNASPLSLELDVVPLQIQLEARTHSAHSTSDALTVLLDHSRFYVSAWLVDAGPAEPAQFASGFFLGEGVTLLVPSNETIEVRVEPILLRLTGGPWRDPADGLRTLRLAQRTFVDGRRPSNQLEIEIPQVRRPDSSDQPIEEYLLP